MKKLIILIACALLLVTGCVSKQVSDNKHIYDHAPFANYNMSVFGFGAFSVTVDNYFTLVESYKESGGLRSIFKYEDKSHPYLTIEMIVDEQDKDGKYPFFPAPKTGIYSQKGRTNVLIYSSDNPYKYHGITIMKFRDIGSKMIYVKFNTGRYGSPYSAKDANHLIAQFDSHIRMVSEGRIRFEMPPCPFNHP